MRTPPHPLNHAPNGAYRHGVPRVWGSATPRSTAPSTTPTPNGANGWAAGGRGSATPRSTAPSISLLTKELLPKGQAVPTWGRGQAPHKYQSQRELPPPTISTREGPPRPRLHLLRTRSEPDFSPSSAEPARASSMSARTQGGWVVRTQG
jgi:hypothetical protein